MGKKPSFREPGCYSCEHLRYDGAHYCATRYCMGVKSKKGKRFKSSDPKYKAPRWCPKRISPVCRIYGFADEHSALLEQMYWMERCKEKDPDISVLSYHFKLRQEFTLGMKAKALYDAAQKGSIVEVLPDADLQYGEIVEIDDGLQPYYFYYLSWSKIVPLAFFDRDMAVKRGDV